MKWIDFILYCRCISSVTWQCRKHYQKLFWAKGICGVPLFSLQKMITLMIQKVVHQIDNFRLNKAKKFAQTTVLWSYQCFSLLSLLQCYYCLQATKLLLKRRTRAVLSCQLPPLRAEGSKNSVWLFCICCTHCLIKFGCYYLPWISLLVWRAIKRAILT